jgi:hypothetical protein
LVSASFAAGQSRGIGEIVELLADAAAEAGLTASMPHRRRAASSTTCWAPPPNSPACSDFSDGWKPPASSHATCA